jgi:hypothetical protein
MMTTVDRGPEIYERAAAFMHERTVAFWGHHDEHTKGEVKQYGSGVLLQIDNVKFVLTAEHVAELFLKHGVSLFLGAASDKLFPISKTSVRHSKKGDVAILVISDEDAAMFGPTKKFTRLSEVLCHDATETVGGVYCALGYPHANSNVDDAAEVLTMKAVPAFGIPYADGQGLIWQNPFIKGVHIAISFDNAKHPDPTGMSGGGMWRIHQAGLPADHWRESDVKLVAIEHTVATNQVALIGTRIGYVLGLIRSFDASLERAINLQWPIKVPLEPGRMVVKKG